MATHSSILAWKIPWTREPGYSPWGHKESDTTEQLTHTPYFYRMFQSLDFLLQIFSCYLFLLHIVPSLHHLQSISLSLPLHLSSFIDCLALETWRLRPLCLLFFSALSSFFSPSVEPLPLHHPLFSRTIAACFLYWDLFLEMNLINSEPRRCK